MFAKLLQGPAAIVYWVGGIWGFVLVVGYLWAKIGGFLTLLSLVVLPFVQYLAPWYAGLVDGYWTPLLVIYGSTGVAIALLMLGSATSKA